VPRNSSHPPAREQGGEQHQSDLTPRFIDLTEGNELANRLANVTDAELVELFGIPRDLERLIPPEKLSSPTLGAVRRARGIVEDPAVPFAHLCDEARVSMAYELAQEARRHILLERLDGVMEFLAVGATPDQAMARIERLIAEYRARPELKVAA
jgi:hypothetical protein